MIKSGTNYKRRQELSVGDQLKLGKITLIVREINNNLNVAETYIPEVSIF